MNRLSSMRLAAALCTGLAMLAAQASNVEAGRQKAQACTVCHGPLGLSTAPFFFNDAATTEIYTAAQLRAYRSGARKHEVMAVMARPLTDDDISNLAAWFASIRVEAQAPQ